MSRDSAGNYSLPAGNPVITDTLIEADNWANPTMSDLAASMTDSLDRQGRGAMLAPLKIVDGTVSAPGLAFNGESNSGIYRDSAGDWRLTRLGEDVLTIDANGVSFAGAATFTGDVIMAGDLLVNADTIPTDVVGDLIVAGASGRLSLSAQVANGNDSEIQTFKSRSADVIVSGDDLFTIRAFGHDGTGFIEGGQLRFDSVGTIATGSIPTEIRLTSFFAEGFVSIYTTNQERFRVTDVGNVGIGAGAQVPLGLLHLKGGSAGTITIAAAADELIVENNGSSGITIISGSGQTSNIYFATENDSRGASFVWSESSDLFTVGTDKGASSLALLSATSVEGLRLTSAQDVGIGESVPLARLHVKSGTNNGLRVETTSGNASGAGQRFYANSPTPADADNMCRIRIEGNTDDNAGGVATLAVEYGEFRLEAITTDDGDFSSRWEWLTSTSGVNNLKMHLGLGLYMNGTVGQDMGVQTINASQYFKDGVEIGPFLLGEIATTSGTTVDFTGIPANAKKLTVQFFGVQTNGTSNWLLQIGDSGGVEVSGYLGSASSVSNSGQDADTFTQGFGMNIDSNNTLMHGSITLTLEDEAANTWVASGSLSRSDAAWGVFTSGTKSLTGVLDRVRLTTIGGAQFQAGVMNILVET